jgi:hypothetical protein
MHARRITVLVALLVTVFSATQAHSHSRVDFGKALQIAKDPNGNARVALSYSYDADWGWMITFKSTVSQSEISALPKKLVWNLYDGKTNSWLSTWQETERESVLLAQFLVSDRAVITPILIDQKDVEIVFAKGNGIPGEYIYHLSLGYICETFPEKVVNLTEEKEPACVVDPSHIPELSKECQDLRKSLLDYIDQQLITCGVAKQAYSDKGCGVLDCK